MNFFTPLYFVAHPGDLDLTIRVKKKNDKLTISVLPEGVMNISPVIITGTPEELDAGFINAITEPLLSVAGLQVETASFNASVDKEKSELKPAKKADKKKAEAKEPKEDEKKAEAPPVAPKEPTLWDE